LSGSGAERAPCELLPWDSEHFRVPIARVRADLLDRELVEAADRWCVENRIACLYLLARSDHRETGQLASEAGFQLTDVRVTYQRRLAPEGKSASSDLPRSLGKGVLVRVAERRDLGPMRELAGRSHRTGRFHFDGHLPAERCDELYRRWIERDLESPEREVLVAEHEGAVVGYFSARAPAHGSERGETSLAAVDPRARGGGVAVGLFTAMLEELRSAGAREVVAHANARNVPGLRLHASAGFVVRSVSLWYHRWYLPAGA
jgi:ribosomal protein S18 acetylase RimI-like enzyme